MAGPVGVAGETAAELIAVVGLGYVGLPVAVGMARAHRRVIGFDIDGRRVAALRCGRDATHEFRSAELGGLDLRYCDDAADLAGRTCFVLTVPTPIDANRQPDLTALCQACETVGRVLAPGGLVVVESTVYPGVTEEVCGPLLARVSGLSQGRDFALGYSPERINPGDRRHRLETVVKVLAASDAAALTRMIRIYEPLTRAGLHVAPSIRVAEAAKVMENTQRDLNIALMNELALICDRLGIRTRDVLEAAGTKWNFLRFTPGLVGGHCIGVDPYYLTAKAEAVGHHPQVILAGRRINDGMGVAIAQKLVRMLIANDIPARGARVGVLGLSFKADVPDIRNSRVPDIMRELASFGIDTMVHDPLAAPEQARSSYGLTLTPLEALAELDALVLAVPHQAYLTMGEGRLSAMLTRNGILIDVKSMLDPARLPTSQSYWSL